MTDENRYLNADESRAVNDYAAQYFENPPEGADSVLDDLDRSILKSEGLPTLETANALAYTRNAEAAQRPQQGPIPLRVRNAIANDDALAALDDVIVQGIRDRAPLSEDGGAAHLNATYDEIAEAEKKVKREQGKAAREMAETARRFMGFGYKTVSADRFYRGRKG
jgi:hypothetical protein